MATAQEPQSAPVERTLMHHLDKTVDTRTLKMMRPAAFNQIIGYLMHIGDEMEKISAICTAFEFDPVDLFKFHMMPEIDSENGQVTWLSESGTILYMDHIKEAWRVGKEFASIWELAAEKSDVAADPQSRDPIPES